MFETMDRDFKRKPELTPEQKAKKAKEHELGKINDEAEIIYTPGSDMVINQGAETRVVRQEKKKESEKRHVIDLISSEARNELIIQAREKLAGLGYSPQEIEAETMAEAKKLAEKEYGNKSKD